MIEKWSVEKGIEVKPDTRYRVIHEDTKYTGQSGEEIARDKYGLIYLHLDSGAVAFFHPEELTQEVNS